MNSETGVSSAELDGRFWAHVLASQESKTSGQPTFVGSQPKSKLSVPHSSCKCCVLSLPLLLSCVKCCCFRVNGLAFAGGQVKYMFFTRYLLPATFPEGGHLLLSQEGEGCAAEGCNSPQQKPPARALIPVLWLRKKHSPCCR